MKNTKTNDMNKVIKSFIYLFEERNLLNDNNESLEQINNYEKIKVDGKTPLLLDCANVCGVYTNNELVNKELVKRFNCSVNNKLELDFNQNSENNNHCGFSSEYILKIAKICDIIGGKVTFTIKNDFPALITCSFDSETKFYFILAPRVDAN